MKLEENTIYIFKSKRHPCIKFKGRTIARDKNNRIYVYYINNNKNSRETRYPSRPDKEWFNVYNITKLSKYIANE